MADDHDLPTPDGAAAVLDELADRATAGIVPPGPQTPATRALDELDAIRQHLHAAHLSRDAGTAVPGDARLRHVKRAVNVGLRPVTSRQVPFNQDVVAALGRLVDVVAELVEAVGGADKRIHEMAGRAAAAVATVEVGQADVEDELARLADLVDELAARTTGTEEGLAAQRQAAGAARVREATVLRAARAALIDHGAGRADLGTAADEVDAELRTRLGAAGRPTPEELRVQAHAVAGMVVDGSAGAPVLDLASGQGEWLDAWATLGLTAAGVDADGEAVAALTARGHTVTAGDPMAHLAATPPGSCGAVTAALVADIVPFEQLVALVDAAILALRPGGVLVLSAAAPSSLSAGSRLWADPRRHLVHPDLLVALAFERGCAEAEIVAPGPVEGAPSATYVLAARTPGAPPAG